MSLTKLIKTFWQRIILLTKQFLYPMDLSIPKSKRPKEPLPYWLVNVPPEEWPNECPEALRDMSEKNIGILATWDSDYTRSTWEEVKYLIGKFF
jgi:hypothetical protein